jgi:uncharacterized iron-regulated membrane protein
MSSNIKPRHLPLQHKSALWRIHFWAAVLASPFALLATLTGIVYVFTPQIEQVLYGHLDTVEAAGQALPLDDVVHAAHRVAPIGWQLMAVVPGHAADDSTRVVFAPPTLASNSKAPAGEHNHSSSSSAGPADADQAKTGQQMGVKKRPSFNWPAKALVVYMNPYTAQVLGEHANQDRFNQWAKRLHSRLLQDDGWRWMIELAASWLMVMLVTGMWLWWLGRSATPVDSALAQSKAAKRARWKRWHSWVGVSMALMSAIILSTGLTWSQQSGQVVRQLRDLAGQAPPTMPSTLQSAAQPGAVMLTWQDAWAIAKQRTPDVSMQLMPPQQTTDVWRISSYDRSKPTQRFDLALDAYSGALLYYSDWHQQTAFSKATAIGIPFHRGEFGVWNQALLLMFGLGLLFSLVSGWMMFYKRHQPGTLGWPPLASGAWRAMPIGFWVSALLMCGLMPLLAWSAAGVAAIETMLHWHQRKAR